MTDNWNLIEFYYFKQIILMKSFAAAALFAISNAALVQLEAESSVTQAFPHTHSQNVAHVDPWVLCKADIEELEREIERLEKLNAEDEITASNLEAQADGLTAIIGPLTSASVQNEVDIGTLGSTESTQQGDIDQLLDNVATNTVDI